MIIECNNIGYEVHTVQSFEGNATIHTHLDIKETAHTLYGFATPTERDLFRTLLSVNGVGAKTAQALLSLGDVTLVNAISSGNSNLIATTKGVSQKIAEKIIIDLGKKISNLYPSANSIHQLNETPNNNETNDALLGLLSLGMPKHTAQTLLAQIDTTDKTAEEIIFLALQKRG